MKKLFYFSKSSLKYIEIRNFKLKLFAVLLISSFLIASFVIVASYFLGLSSSNTIKINSLTRENNELKNEIRRITSSYEDMLEEVDRISLLNKEFRNSVNLEPISEEEILLGTGGTEDFFNLGLNIQDNEIEDMLISIDKMITRVNFEKIQANEIADALSSNKELYNSIPAINPTGDRYSTSDYGMRRHPILGIRKFHHGLDLNCNRGTPVRVTGDGKVTAVERQSGFGLVIEVKHGFGYSTVYAHLSKALVKRGQKVTRGQVIAKSGNTGLSTGPHLHYEVRHNGKSLNPIDFFFDEYTFFDLDTTTISLTEK